MIGALVLAAALAANDPVSLVDTFIGTGGTSGVGLADDFPGASAPFGMVQWSPDTPSQPPSGGYLNRDTAITGFSVTHLSGAGCTIFGDFGVLPTVGEIADPSHASIPFAHDTEQASPGYYAVALGNGTHVELATTQRVGFGTFTFPASSKANLLVNVSSDQAGVADSQFRVAGPSEIVGFAKSGGFCGMPNEFTVYLDMRFDRPFVAHGTWNGDAISPGSDEVHGTKVGGYLTFDATQNQAVRARVAVSYVSIDGARANLAAEHVQDVDSARAATANAWRSLLGEVKVSGGRPVEQKMFYSALYHAMLSPTLYNDADGRYLGFDGRVHRVASGHNEYANFSGWDIWRTQIPLIALLAPRETSDMMQTLVHNAQQGGWLPKWPVANAYTGVMGGDPADLMIANAYAFGARNFDVHAALRAMVKGATEFDPPGQGWYHPRPGLDEYVAHGYVTNSHTTNVSPVPNGASLTLEYAMDDFAISQLARTLGRENVYRTFARRGMSWTNVFDTASGLAQPRDGDGAFEHPPITDNGQSGFQEGNAAQYTWIVPQSAGLLVKALGGPANTVARLDTFFTKLNAGQVEPYAWFGNEPSLISPWTYLFAGAPYKAQAVNRNVILTLYSDTPDGIPGNDDLGTMSAWLAWNMLGLYPYTPATPVLLTGAPMFTHVSIAPPTGPRIEIDAPNASDANMYVQGVRVQGRLSRRSWVRLPQHDALRLDIDLGAAPNVQFASAPQDAPPSYEYGQTRFPQSTTASLGLPPSTLEMKAGTSVPLPLTIGNTQGASPVQVAWTAQAPEGFTVTPASGNASAVAGAAPTSPSLIASAGVVPGLYNVTIRGRASNGAAIAHATAVVRVPAASGALPLSWIANFSDNTIMAIDPRTHAYSNQIAVGKAPGDLAVSHDGTRVYTANQSDASVSVVDAVAEKTIATVKVGEVPAGIRISPDGATVWVTNYNEGTLQPIDVATLRAGKPIAVGNHPEDLAVSPDGSRVYVADQGSNELAVVDARGRTLIQKVPVGQSPLGVAVTPDNAHIYVSNTASNDVSVVDASTLRAIARIPVGKAPQGLAISPDGKVVYVTDSGSGQISPIDTATNTARAAILVGNGPFGVAFSKGSKTAVVANSADNTCVVIDVEKGAVIATVPTASFPIAVGISNR